MIENKISPFDECSCFVCQNSKQAKKYSSVCPSVRTWIPGCRHNNFRRSYRIETKFGGCRLCIKCSSGFEIESKSMIVILIRNRILILTKTLRNDTKFGGYLQYIKCNFCYWIPWKNPDPENKILEKVYGKKLNFMSIINI